MSDNPLDPIEVSVKPRTTGYAHLPLLAVRRGEVLTENGVIGQLDKIDWRRLPPTLVVGVNLASLVADLDERYRRDSDWQWKARDSEMMVGKLAVQQRTLVDFFGFQASREGKHAANHYHYCLDAFAFYSNTFTLTTEQTDTVEGLMKWGMTIRDYCRSENLSVRPTASGLAAQYLRDPRFYPTARRKVPRATNESVRTALPGNHYQLEVSVSNRSNRWNALEIDQTRAHHFHAEHTPLPDAYTLFAFGDFENLAHVTATNPHPDFIGLYHMWIDSPHPRTGRHPHWSPLRGQHPTNGGYFVFSNELPMLQSMGYTIRGIVAGWGSRVRDNGIPLYARHAQSQLDTYDNASWLKPILLTTYGLLAVKARVPAAVFRQAKNGEPYVLLAGGRQTLHGLLVSHTDGNVIEPGICNVLHRGLIEAATRAFSLEMAEYLTYFNYRVLQVYADSVIVEDNPDRPLWRTLNAPWRVKQTLTDFMPINSHSFVSVEKTRMPGVPDRDAIMRRRGWSSTTGGGQPPVKTRWEAASGRPIYAAEQRKLGLPIRHV